MQLLKKEKKEKNILKFDIFLSNRFALSYLKSYLKGNETFLTIKKKKKMMTEVVDNNNLVDPIWKDRIERAFKHICRTIDLRQRRDIV